VQILSSYHFEDFITLLVNSTYTATPIPIKINKQLTVDVLAVLNQWWIPQTDEQRMMYRQITKRKYFFFQVSYIAQPFGAKFYEEFVLFT